MVGHRCVKCRKEWNTRDAEASSPCPWCDNSRLREDLKHKEAKIERLEEELLHASYTVPDIVEQRNKLLDRVEELEENFRREHNARMRLDEFKRRLGE